MYACESKKEESFMMQGHIVFQGARMIMQAEWILTIVKRKSWMFMSSQSAHSFMGSTQSCISEKRNARSW